MSKHNRPEPQRPPPRSHEPPPGATWNNIRRLWLVAGQPLDPQPPPPRAATADIQPAVKVALWRER